MLKVPQKRRGAYEVRFVETAQQDLLKSYLNKFSLCPEAEQRLVELAEPDFIKVYILRRPLCAQAQIKLVELQNKDLIQLYGELWKWSPDAEKLL